MKANNIAIVAVAALCSIGLPAHAASQAATHLSLEEARSLARLASPELSASEAAVDAARGRERQAGAFANPELVYSTERTSGAGQSNSQHIASIDQRLNLGGQRGVRRAAAASRRRAAEARVEGARALVDFEVARAYAHVIAADRRALLARQAAAAFTEAGRVSERRLAAGDISGYADRRLRLEAARYGALAAEATLASRSARIALSALISPTADTIASVAAVLTDSIPGALPGLNLMMLSTAALRNRADYHAASLEREALAAEGRLATLERIPSPVFSAGFKTEKAAGLPEPFNGFIAGFSFPIPLFDRRSGAIQAAEADTRRASAEAELLRRRVVREVAEAYAALGAVEEQRVLLAPQLGAPAVAALKSAEVAYSEGEITLLEWLDAVRAYHEAESSYSNLLAELLIRRATLERAVSSPLGSLNPMQDTPGATPDARNIESEKER